MNTFRFDEITVGQEASFPIRITGQEMDMFRQMTGDENPLHCDKEYARLHGHGDRVAYGMLTASYLSTLAGMYLPGERSLIHEVEVKFLKPVVLGEAEGFVVRGKVTEKNETFKRLVIKVSVVGNNGVKYLRGAMKVGVVE